MINNQQNTYNQPPMGQRMMPPQMGLARPKGWRERMMRNYGMGMYANIKNGVLTIPQWLTGKSIVFFFVAMFASWAVFGYVPDVSLILVASLSVVLFFYGGVSISKTWEHRKEKAFLKNVFITGFIIRLIWVLYMYFFFNPEYYGNTFGDEADTTWYMPFGQDLAEWMAGNSKHTFSQILDINKSAIDDLGYPIWLGVVYLIFGSDNEVFIPFILKSIMSAYCAVLMYRVAKRHFGEGTARITAIFVCLNPNMIYWCATMMKETEMVFVTCLAVNYLDKALSSGARLTIKSLFPGLLAVVALFFIRTALGLALLLGVVFHIVMASSRVLSLGKKIIAGILVVIVIMFSVGDRILEQSQSMYDDVQTGGQKENMAWRGTREGGNSFAKYAGAAVFGPLIVTIPFPTFNVANETQLVQAQLAGGSFIKNILSFFVIMVFLLLLISGDWRRHVFILAYTAAYLAVLVFSAYAQSGRFHMPVIPMLMLFAAYGVQIAKGNTRFRRMYTIVLVIEVAVCLAWNWFKLKGRGLI